jgi:hypothetical protein
MTPITTSGFQVQAQPGMNYLPASQLVGNLSGILPAASQGASLVSQLAQIQDQAQAEPLRRQLQQIQLQEAQNRLAQAPIAQQIQLAQLAHANQPLERVLGTDIQRLPRINSPEDSPALDANGNPTFAEGDTNYDLTPIQRVEVTDPRTGLVNIEQRKLTPLATAETLGDRSDKIEIERLKQESLAGQRDTQRQLAIDRLNSPDWKRFGYGVDAAGKQVYLLVNSKTGQRQEVPTDLIPVPTGMDALTGVMSKIAGVGPGATNIAAPITVPGLGGASAPAIVAPEDTPAIDPEAQSLITDLTSAFQVAPAASPAYKTADQVKAAFKSGALPRAQAEKILREQFGLK